jgi:hypothetical protein
MQGKKTNWKVLWTIIPKIEAYSPIRKVTYKTQMTTEQINMVKRKALWFEEFVEAHTNNKVDIQITTIVLKEPITKLGENKDTIFGIDEKPDEIQSFDPEKNYDSIIYTSDFTGIPINFRANSGNGVCLIPFKQEGFS